MSRKVAITHTAILISYP